MKSTTSNFTAPLFFYKKKIEQFAKLFSDKINEGISIRVLQRYDKYGIINIICSLY